jgi:HAD superfamily hydrolase (TIGR01509 family)
VRIGALLFDLDGTLVDSHHEICLSLDTALRELGLALPFHEVEALVDGAPLEAVYQKLDGKLPKSVAYSDFAERYRSHYMRDLGHASRLFPGVADTLSHLRSQLSGVMFSIVSNKSAGSVTPLIERLGIAHCFDLALGCGGTAIRPKPHPDLLMHAAERLSRRPEACIMIGDTLLDVEAGRRAGMRTIAVTHGMAPRDAFLEAGADHVVDHFSALKPLLIPA